MLAILGMILALLGLLGLLHIIGMPLAVALILLVGGIVLAAYDQRAHFRRP